ncbi:hypothetical protein BKA93DRAFT_215873 [Sparassis latifolia]|uniref:Uncharacterized protein n=1 Tax=Sparassis crispa TaxID=139825 RepID=A0A401GR60_9APHY|nr:hypothetical protein SCP_0606740 [Sparassis crispa]GBE84695.1 hypothetical protein SCP_0606740 [Sparassis crispa]
MSSYKLLTSLKLYIFSCIFGAKPIATLPFDDKGNTEVAEPQKNTLAVVTEIGQDALIEDPPRDATGEVAEHPGLAAEGIHESEQVNSPVVISNGSSPDPVMTSPCPCTPRLDLIQLSEFSFDTVYGPLYEGNEDAPLIGLGLMGLSEHIKDISTISDSLDSPHMSYLPITESVTGNRYCQANSHV